MTLTATCFVLFLFAFVYVTFGIVIWAQPLLYLVVVVPVIVFVLFLCYLLNKKE